MNLSIEEIRKLIAGRALSHIHECKREGIVQYLVVKTFPGSGKTTSIMMAIDKAGYNWIYLAPFHDIVRENLKFSRLRNYDFTHLMGKSQKGVCLSKDYRNYAKQGINIDPFCEIRCPYRHNGCPYYEAKEKIESYPENWAGVHSHVPTYLQKFLFQTYYNDKQMYRHYDVLIIDEFPFQVLFNQEIIKRKDIDDLRNVINYMTLDTKEKWFSMNFLDQLTLATGDIDINHRKLKFLLEANRGLDFNSFLKEYDVTLLRLISNEIVKYPPKNLLFNLSLIHSENPSLQKLEWMIHKHKYDGWSTPGIYVTTSNVNYFRNLPLPVIALDATAEIDAWNVLLNDVCRKESIDIEYRNIYQLKSHARYPVATWVEFNDDNNIQLTSVGTKLCELIVEICKRKKYSVLICSNKRIRALIEDYLNKNYDKNNYEFAIYYNLRSRNRYYETCDSCIISHEPNIPPLQLEIMNNVIGWDVDLLRNLMTTSEIKQAIGRVRQNIIMTPEERMREDVEIFIFPGAHSHNNRFLEEVKLIPYENMYLGKLLTLQDVLKSILEKIEKTSVKSLAEYTSDLCSLSALKSELKRMYLNGYISDYKRKIKWLFKNEKETKYKRED